jgi:hypothetical protein
VVGAAPLFAPHLRRFFGRLKANADAQVSPILSEQSREEAGLCIGKCRSPRPMH